MKQGVLGSPSLLDSWSVGPAGVDEAQTEQRALDAAPAT
jgi:hypothetical protein